MVVGRTTMSEVVSLNPRFMRSVHLERDFYSKDARNGYLLTRGALSALSLLARGFSDPSYRAQCISGPYGSGKSALALYFAKLLDKTPSNNLRDSVHEYFGERGEQSFPSGNQGYVTILATGTRESLSASLVRNLKRSLELSGRQHLFQELLRKHGAVMKDRKISTRSVVEVFEDLAKLVVEKEQGLGIVVVVDELGKLLEHAALHPEESDMQVLQELAEAASRSHECPIWFVTILHQQFSQYAFRLGRGHQREWARVQQRFFDVPCMLDGLDALQLVATALNGSANEDICNNIHIRATARACTKLAPRGSESDFEKLCISCYPLHPTTLALLPALFRRFGQNERSLFSFLSAEEPFSLAEWVRSQYFRADDPAFLRLPQLYDYACHTLIGGAPTPQIAHAWAEVEDAITRLGDAAKEEIDVLKTIGLLGLVGESSHIPASREVLQLTLTSPQNSDEVIASAIQTLVEKRLIVFRRFRNAYRLWEGSDVDISEHLSSAYQMIPSQSVVLSVARDLCPSPQLVARRHSFHTGMLRAFYVVPSSNEDLLAACDAKHDYDGCVVQCLVENDEQQASVAAACRELSDPSVIVLIGEENDELAEAARDVAALEWVKKNTPALAGDRVARQELSARRLEAETAFRSEWNNIFGSGSGEVICYWQGEERRISSARDFTSLLSDACDTTFPHAPVVKNELINRRHLSSAAAAARRNLIEAMISSSDKQGLDITGYPPQRSIYESLLLQSAIHRRSDNGQWRFGRPDDSDPGLQKAWDYILKTIQSDHLNAKSVSELFKELSGSPYGVADGFVPVLLCACLIANSSTMALYEDKVFLPELSVPAMERLMRRPENFSVVSFELGGERSAVVERFACGFNVDSGVLPVVRSLYARMGSLPKYTEITRNLSPEAIAVRETILRAKSPERLLFMDLPTVLGCQPFQPSLKESMNNGNIEAFFNALNKAFHEFVECYPNLLERVRRGLIQIFDVAKDESDWLGIVSKRASKLYEAATDSRLRTVIVRAREAQLGEVEYLESVGAGIVGQPPSRWSKADEDNFARLVPQLAYQVRAVESLQYLDSVLEDNEDGYLLSINGRNIEAVRHIIRFSVKERDEIDKLARILSEGDSFSTNRRILLAAIAKAAHRLMTTKETEKEEDSDGRFIEDE